MTGVILVGIIAAVVGGVFVARVLAARADSRSIARHEQLLGTLGGVARKSDASAPIAAPAKKDVARPHVQVAADESAEQAPSMLRPTVPPRIRLEPLEHVNALPVFGEVESGSSVGRASILYDRGHRRRRKFTGNEAPASDAAPEAARDSELVAAVASAGPPIDASASSLPVPRRSLASRKALPIGLVVALLVVGVGALSWDLGKSHGKNHLASATQRSHQPSHRAIPVTAPPTTVEPTAVSESLVSFVAPTGGYSFTFKADGLCWIGIERVVNGPYVWMKTLSSGDSVTYQMSGRAVVRIGAPRVLSMQLNGVKVDLPSSNVNPFDAVFS